MTRFTMTRIEIEDQARLKAWAKLNRRSATQQLGMFIPPLTPVQATEALEPEELAAWKPNSKMKPQAKFGKDKFK